MCGLQHAQYLLPPNCCLCITRFMSGNQHRGEACTFLNPVSDIPVCVPFSQVYRNPFCFSAAVLLVQALPMSSLGPKHTITAVLLAHSTSQGCFHCLLLLQPKRVTKPWIPGVSWKVTGAGSMGMRFPLAHLDELRRASTGSALFVTARLFLPHLGRLLTQSQQYLV